jgi:hypothetical protein
LHGDAGYILNSGISLSCTSFPVSTQQGSKMVVHQTISRLAILAVLPFAAALAQSAPAAPPLQLSPAFRELARASGYIFTGTVTSVSAGLAGESAPPAIEITFRVEQPYRGVQRGQPLRIREWAPLWNAGQRYRVGERALFFLYPQSKLGLTSVVGQPAGRIPTSASGFIISPAQYATWFNRSSRGKSSKTGEQILGARQLSNAVQRACRERK